MNYYLCQYYYVIIVCLYTFSFVEVIQAVKGNETESKNEVIDEIIPKLYDMYKDAILNDLNISSRRFQMNGEEYLLHVQKLKEMGTLKRHNLKVEGKTGPRSHSSIIYINNPVEARLPNAFITVEEFKESLMRSIELQKQEVLGKKFKQTTSTKKKHKKRKHRKTKKPKRTRKLKSKRKNRTKPIITEYTKPTRTKTTPKQIINTKTVKESIINKFEKNTTDNTDKSTKLPSITTNYTMSGVETTNRNETSAAVAIEELTTAHNEEEIISEGETTTIAESKNPEEINETTNNEVSNVDDDTGQEIDLTDEPETTTIPTTTVSTTKQNRPYVFMP